MPRMYGKTIVLRELRWEDLPEVRAWMTHGPTASLLGDRFVRPQTWEQTENYLRDLVEGNAAGVHFAIAEPEKLRYLGQLALTGIDPVARKCRLMIVLKPEEQGKGYGTEALRLALEYAFRWMNLERVALSVQADNLRAIRAYERVGFRHEGRLRREAYRDGAYIDVLEMGILREEFEGVCPGQAMEGEAPHDPTGEDQQG